jgi:hypothetical protein
MGTGGSFPRLKRPGREAETFVVHADLSAKFLFVARRPGRRETQSCGTGQQSENHPYIMNLCSNPLGHSGNCIYHLVEYFCIFLQCVARMILAINSS